MFIRSSFWDKHEDERLDDGTTDIDSLDAEEYATFPFYDKLMTNIQGINKGVI